MRDLEIRGAGNILGASRAGTSAPSATTSTCGSSASHRRDPLRSPGRRGRAITLDLPLTALIPEDYVPDTELRLQL